MTKNTRRRIALYGVLVVALIASAFIKYSTFSKNGFINQFLLTYPVQQIPTQHPPERYVNLANAAEARTKENITYDGSYVEISYPMGDVDKNIGVCTDVLIRSYRTLGVDLQELVHNDIKDNFFSYPKMWRLTAPDTNIDHRRVPNLMTFFKRQGACLPITVEPRSYKPGDIVSWDLGGGLMHIGIVSSSFSKSTKNPLIVHNIGSGLVKNDMLFKYRIIGHFRY